jgi:hypothetical protein
MFVEDDGTEFEREVVEGVEVLLLQFGQLKAPDSRSRVPRQEAGEFDASVSTEASTGLLEVTSATTADRQ